MEGEPTTIAREDLLAALEPGARILKRSRHDPRRAWFCFRDGKVVAFDGVLAISTPFHPGLGVCANGILLNEWTKVSHLKELSLERQNSKLRLAGRQDGGESYLVMPTATEEDFDFKFPTTSAPGVLLTDDLLRAIRQCLLCGCAESALEYWQWGMTLAFGADEVRLYSCGDLLNHMSACSAPAQVPDALVGRQVAVPRRFCEELLRLSRVREPEILRVTDAWVDVRFEDDVRLWSRTIIEPEASKYERLLKTVDWSVGFHGFHRKRRVVEVLTQFSALGRAEGPLAEPIAEMEVTDGVLHLRCANTIGEVTDWVLLPGHPDVAARANARPMLQALRFADSMQIIRGRAVALQGRGFRHMLSGEPHTAEE